MSNLIRLMNLDANSWHVKHDQNVNADDQRQDKPCPACDGKGVNEYGITCSHCNGKGRVDE